MTLKQLADETVAALEKAFPESELDDAKRAKISKIVEHTLLNAVDRATQSHRAATVVCCGPDADIAHKIAEEVDRANTALTAHLTALR